MRRVSGSTSSRSPHRGGVIDPDELAAASADAAAVFFQQPNYLGCLEDAPGLAAAANDAGALSVAHVDLMSLGVLEAPGAYGCAIALGEGQSAGNWPSYGGPHYGFLAARCDYVRRMPGRIVGETVDARRPPRVRAHAADAGAAHPAREGDLEHHDEPDAARARRAGDAVVARAGGAARGRGDVPRARRSTRASGCRSSPRSTHGSFKEVAFRTPLPAREVIRRAREHGVNPGYALGRDYEGMDDVLLVARHREEERRGRRPARGRAREVCAMSVPSRERAWRETPLIFERSRSGRRAGRPPRPDLPGPGASRLAAPCDAAASSRAGGARDRAALHGARRPHLRRRHRLLPARLLHDEAQPARARAARRAPRLPRPPPARRGRGRPGRARAHVAPAGDPRRGRRPPGGHAAAGGGLAGRAHRPHAHARVLRRARRGAGHDHHRRHGARHESRERRDGGLPAREGRDRRAREPRPRRPPREGRTSGRPD